MVEKKSGKGAGMIIALVGGFAALAALGRAETQPTVSCPVPPIPQGQADYFNPVYDDNSCVISWTSKFFPEPDPCPQCPVLPPTPPMFPTPSTGECITPVLDNQGYVIGWQKVTGNCQTCPPEANPTNCSQYCPECPTPPTCPDIPFCPVTISGDIAFGEQIPTSSYGHGTIIQMIQYPITNLTDHVIEGTVLTTSVDFENREVVILKKGVSFVLRPHESRFMGFGAAKWDAPTRANNGLSNRNVPYHYIIEFILQDGSIVGRIEDSYPSK